MSAPSQPPEFGDAGVVVYDSGGAGTSCRIDRTAPTWRLRGGGAARDARLPLDEVLDEIGGVGGQLDEFEPAFMQPSR